jgi:two-component system response regulator AtoC
MHVLVIDDEPAVRQILAAAVEKAGYTVDQAATFAAATNKLARGDVDVALCDIKLPDGSGLDLLRNSRAGGLETTFVMVTGFASVETAVEALRAGASDFVTKPVHNEEILHRLEQIRAMGGLREENTALRRKVSEGLPKLFRFASPRMAEVDRMVSKVAPTPSTVLLTGESGTGKGVVSRAIHEQSPRGSAQFLSVNCSAIPEQLLESELFGHTRGAFTSADHAHKGLFEQADGGTLFLDEIGDLPMHMQSKLLHVIEDKQVRPLGSERVRRVDVRIIAATNRNLVDLVKVGQFREDLYFRLSMFEIHIPPLRDRRDDIPGLIRFLLRASKAEMGVSGAEAIDPIAEEPLLTYPWPGNVRELENVINRARILAEGDCITLGDLPSEVIKYSAPAAGTDFQTSPDGSLRERLRRFENEMLLRAVEEAGGDRRLAAQRLGIGLSSLYRKLEEPGDRGGDQGG